MRSNYTPAPRSAVGHARMQPSFWEQGVAWIKNTTGAALDKVFSSVIQDKVPGKGQRTAEKDEGMLSTCISLIKKYTILAFTCAGMAWLWHAHFPGYCPDTFAKMAEELEICAQNLMESARNFGSDGAKWREVAVLAQELAKSIKVALGLA